MEPMPAVQRGTRHSYALGELEVHAINMTRAIDEKNAEYESLAEIAAEAEVDYKHAFAKASLVYQDAGKSVAGAEMRATAQDDIRDMHRAYLGSKAAAGACLESLRSMRQRLEVGRSLIASARDQDRNHSQFGGP